MRAVARCVSFHDITSNVPTLTSNIPGTAPGEYKGRAEQQEQGQAEQAKLPKSNQEVAGGTLDPAPPYNKMTGRAGGTHDPVNKHWRDVSPKIPKPST